MTIAILGVFGAYIITSIIFLHKPSIIHKKHKRWFYAQHISHRGGGGERTENTMPAFERAVSLRTNMLELDCHLLCDGKVVVCHDEDLRRLCDVNSKISEFNIDNIPKINEKLQVTFSPDKYYERSLPNEDKFVLLEEVFKSFPEVPVNIDIKIESNELIEKVNKLVLKYKRENITVWGNRSDRTNSMCYSVNPNIGLVFSQKRTIITLILFYTGLLPFFFIKERYFEIPMLDVFLEPEFKGFSLSKTNRFLIWFINKLLLRPALIKHLHRRGIPTFVWVCNKEDQFEKAYKCGAEGVMTDYPTLLRNYLTNHHTHSIIDNYSHLSTNGYQKFFKYIDESTPVLSKCLPQPDSPVPSTCGDKVNPKGDQS